MRRHILIQFVLILMCKLFSIISKMKLTTKVIPPSGKTHSATVIFFHGSGDTGNNLVDWVRFLMGRNLEFGHIKIIYPTAPVQPYTPLGGELSNVWFDRKFLHISTTENRKSLAAIYETVKDLIDAEINLGISTDRIIVGGFSMGGVLAMHIGYHIFQDLAGVFTCSSFLNNDSIVYDSIRQRNHPDVSFPEILMFHGDRDSLVPIDWGQKSYQELINLGIKGEFITLKNTMHELKKKELVTLQEWVLKILPPIECDLTNKL